MGASAYSVPRSYEADFRLHYIAEYFSFNTTEMHFTGVEEREILTRYNKNEGE